MQLIGTISETPNEQGVYTLITHGLPIPLVKVDKDFAGKRVKLQGSPIWRQRKGSFFKIYSCKETAQKDYNRVIVGGRITKIMPEIVNKRGERSACLVIQPAQDYRSQVLITILGDKIDNESKFTSLNVGDSIRVSGYVTYNTRGLHILYLTTVREECSKKPDTKPALEASH